MSTRPCKGCEKPLHQKEHETPEQYARRRYHGENCRNIEFRRKKRQEDEKIYGDLTTPKPMPDIGLKCKAERPRLDAVLKALPEGHEPAVPFPGLVEDHVSCLHPEGGHTPRKVEVTAVLERTAVVLGPSGYRWLERHESVLVVPADFRIKVQGSNAIQAADARTRGREIARIRRMADGQANGKGQKVG